MTQQHGPNDYEVDIQCPDCGGTGAQPVEATPCNHDQRFKAVFCLPHGDSGCLACALESAHRQLSLAQTENAGHIRIEDELKAELREVEKDAARLNWIFSTLHDGEIRERLQEVSYAHAMGGMKGPIRVGDFRAAIDAAISATKP